MGSLIALEPQDEQGRLASLRRWNLGVGSAHLAQAVAILLLAAAVSLPVSIDYLIVPPGAGEFGGPKLLFDLRIDIAVAAFLLLAAVDHISVATWGRGDTAMRSGGQGSDHRRGGATINIWLAALLDGKRGRMQVRGYLWLGARQGDRY